MQSSVWKDTSSQWQPCNFSPDSQCQTVLKRAEDAPELRDVGKCSMEDPVADFKYCLLRRAKKLASWEDGCDPLPLVVTRCVRSCNEGYGEDALWESFLDTTDNAENDGRLRKYAPKELFSEAAIRADLASSTSKQPDIKKFGNVLWSVGVPGIGKKTLGRQLLECVLREQQSNESCYIFCFSMTEDILKYPREISLFEFLCLGSSMDYDRFHNSEQHIVNDILSTDDVYIIMDTLPRLPGINWDKVGKIFPETKRSAASFFRAILSNKLFPEAKKYIAMQIKEFCLLPYQYRPAFMVKVLGLGIEEQEKLRWRCCNSEDEAKLFKQMLIDYPELCVFLHNPSCCNALGKYCFSIYSKLNERQQSNRFYVLVSSLLSMLTDYCVADQNIRKLFSAFSCLCCVVLYDILARDPKSWHYAEHKFCKWYCEETGRTSAYRSEIGEKIVARSMEKILNVYISEEPKPCSYPPQYFYSSYSFMSGEWADIFSAFSLRFLLKTGFLERSIFELTQRHVESDILTLLFFSVDSCTQASLQQCLLPEMAEDDSKDERQKQLLIHLRKVAFQPTRITNAKDVFLKCRWARASQDREILDDLQRIVKSAPIELHGHITVSRACDIGYVLQSNGVGQKSEVFLGVEKQYIDCDKGSLGVLLEVLNPSASVAVRTLLLEQTDIVSKDIKMLPKYFGVLNKLELYNCNMNSETVSALANGISGSSNPLPVFAFKPERCQHIDDGAKMKLVGCAANVKDHLELRRCNLNQKHIALLATYLKQNKHQIKLDLSFNDFTDEAAKQLFSCANYISGLTLRSCILRGKSLLYLKEEFEKLSYNHTLQALDLSENNMMGPAAQLYLPSCLQHVRDVTLNSCSIDDNTVASLLSGLLNRKSMMEKLSLRDNEITMVGADSLARVANVLIIDLASNKISKYVVKTLRAMAKARKKIVILEKQKHIPPQGKGVRGKAIRKGQTL